MFISISNWVYTYRMTFTVVQYRQLFSVTIGRILFCINNKIVQSLEAEWQQSPRLPTGAPCNIKSLKFSQVKINTEGIAVPIAFIRPSMVKICPLYADVALPTFLTPRLEIILVGAKTIVSPDSYQMYILLGLISHF